MKYFSLAITVLFFASCENLKKKEAIKLPDSGQADYKEQIIGEWRSIYMKLTLHSYQNADSTKVMEVHEAEWEHVMAAKPIRTFFNTDGTYRTEHRNLNDSIVYNPAGNWRIAGDSLFMSDTFPQKKTDYRFQISISSDLAEFKERQDFDGDGMRDDEYFGRQRKQK